MKKHFNDSALDSLAKSRIQTDPDFEIGLDRAKFLVDLANLRSKTGISQQIVGDQINMPQANIARLEKNIGAVRFETVLDYLAAIGYELVAVPTANTEKAPSPPKPRSPYPARSKKKVLTVREKNDPPKS